MKDYPEFDLLENADEPTIAGLSEHYPAAGRKERGKIYRMAVKKADAKQGKLWEAEPADENEEIYELKGVGLDMKNNWRKPFAAAAACLLLVGGVFGGAFLLRNSREKNDSPADSYYTSVADENKKEKTTIKVAFVCNSLEQNSDSYNHIISDYNSHSDKYKAELVVYTSDEGQSAVNKLNADFADGKTPDVIYAETTQLRSLYDHGYLSDLGEIMDKYSGIKRDEIVPSLLNAITIDGHIPCIPDSIRAETVCVETDLLGGDITNWNFEQAIKFYNSISKDDTRSFLESGADRENLTDFFITGGILSSMDYRNYEFDAEKGLRQALEFIYSLPEDKNDHKEISLTMPRPYLTMPYVCVSSFYSQRAIGYHCGKDISLVGYPTESGNGALVSTYYGMSIMDNSSCKQGAWDYINYTTIPEDNKYVTSSDCLTLRASLYPRFFDSDPLEGLSVNQGYTVDGAITWDKNEVAYRINDAQKQQLNDYINSLDICIYRDLKIEDIIREECAYVVSGERTPDQCIDILNDRIGTYLAENK